MWPTQCQWVRWTHRHRRRRPIGTVQPIRSTNINSIRPCTVRSQWPIRPTHSTTAIWWTSTWCRRCNNRCHRRWLSRPSIRCDIRGCSPPIWTEWIRVTISRRQCTPKIRIRSCHTRRARGNSRGIIRRATATMGNRRVPLLILSIWRILCECNKKNVMGCLNWSPCAWVCVLIRREIQWIRWNEWYRGLGLALDDDLAW